MIQKSHSSENKTAFTKNIKDEINLHITVDSVSKSQDNCFIVKPTSKWIDDAKLRPIPNMLFDVFWFENEVCILFADTNIGKSILALQIADSISRNSPIYGFRLETGSKKVLYFDFELSDKQLENRYSNNYQNHYKFHHNLFRAEINTEAEKPKEFKNFEDFLCHSIERQVEDLGIQVIVIDNITYLKDALPLMKQLKALAKKHNLSILVLAHTPKRNASQPITKNDLAGSKMLINFCDSSFTIGDCANVPKQRYLKQVKQRNTEHVYHADNVILCEIKSVENFLGFNFIGYSEEESHLKRFSTENTLDRNSKVIELKSTGLPNTQIAKQLGVSEGTIRNILKNQID